MNKLLALSIALLSLNLYGAERTITLHGLEGWGKVNGVWIALDDYSNRDKTFDVKAIKNQVELKLRLAGIKVEETTSLEWITINMMPSRVGDRVIGYDLLVIPKRTITFKYDGKEYFAVGGCKRIYRSATSLNYRPSLDKHLDQLLLDYLKANPITPKDQ